MKQRWFWAEILPFVILFIGCGAQYADPIVDGSAGSPEDACAQWATADACARDTAHGCSFQPNQSGCLSSDSKCTVGQCRGGEAFVSRVYQTLWLHDAPFRFVGAVSWGTAGWENNCRYWNFDSHEAVVDKTFDELTTMRASVLRFWAYQSYAGATGLDFSRFERIVEGARRAGVRLIPVLESMWTDCTEGGEKTDAWFASGYRSPYGAYALSYRDYVQAIVTHFRDEPTILAWELMHEAQATDATALSAFVDDMTQVIRTVDSNHLVSVGLDDGNSVATSVSEGSPSNYQRLHAFANVDLIDVHDFTDTDASTVANFPAILGIAANLKKPVFIGAGAVTLEAGTQTAYANRAKIVDGKIEATLRAGAVGFLVYEYNPGWSDLGWSFDGRTEEPLAGPNGVIAGYAASSP